MPCSRSSRNARRAARSKPWVATCHRSRRFARDGEIRSVAATDVVPGDVLVLAEGDRVAADARLLSGAVEIDASALSGESAPVERVADAVDDAARPLDSPVLVFSGTGCVGGSAEAVVHGTGAHTEIGRIAALSGRAPGRATAPWNARSAGWPT